MKGSLERMEDLRADPQAFREGLSPPRDDHELLEVDPVVRMDPSVEHVHHRHGHHRRGLPSEVAPQRQTLLGCLRVRSRQRYAEDRVRSQATLVGRPIELDQGSIECLLVGRIQARHRLHDLPVDVRDGLGDALALPALAAVAQLDRLQAAGRGARRHRGVPVGPRAQPYLNLDRWIAAAVEDLAGADALDLAHRPAAAPIT